MAAYGALTFLSQILDNILGSNFDRVSLDRDQLESLREKVRILQLCLPNTSTRTRRNREAMERLEVKIREVAFRAEDLMATSLHPELVLFSQMYTPSVRVLPKFIKGVGGLFVRQDLKLLKEVVKDVKLIVKEAAKIAGDATDAELPPLGRSSVASSTNVVGLDDDLETIKEMLVSDPSNLKIVPIVGMGGIGKTTLATQVYKDAYVRQRFDVCAWATVSQDYSFRRILQDLLNSAKLPTMQGERSDGELGGQLYQSFFGRRYLVVLDDVWDVKIWDAVKRFLPQDQHGSCVLVTTRSSEVARYAGSQGSQHQMHFLPEHESQKLLHSQVFGDASCPDELRGIQDEIAHSCKGLPLALVVIGGLLSKIDRTRDSWRSFASSLRLASGKENDDECMEILALSYNHLPHHLRPCFLYMGMFPEDHAIPVTKLIQLWVGEGFLQRDNSKCPEELAEAFLEELIERNLILISSWSSQGKMKRCKIHDVLRKLCLREAQKEKFLFVINRHIDVFTTGVESYRRLSIHSNVLKSHPKIMYDKELLNTTAHSLMCIGNNFTSPPDKYLHYRPLRVLDLLALHFAMFPLEVTRLGSLRYLALSFNGPLHPRISKLQNLQIFVHQNRLSHEIFSLPVEVWSIPNLQHIHIPPTFLPALPNGDSLSSLQTLAEVINLSFDAESLGKIRSLKKLCVSYEAGQQPFNGWLWYRLGNLARLSQLEKLRFKVNSILLSSGVTYPQKLAFPQSLKKLTLSGCRFPWEHLAVIGVLPNLEVLKLRRNACQGAEWEPVEGQFLRLIFLELQHMDIVHWKADETHFPRLQRLVVNSCHQLEEIPLSIGDIPTLQSIELVNCHPGIKTSAENIRMYQEEMTGSLDLDVSVSYSYLG